MPKKRSHRRASQKLLPLSAAERKIDAILPLFDEGETERALELLLAMRGRYRLPGRYYSVRGRAHDVTKTSEGFLVELIDAAPGYEQDVTFQMTLTSEFAKVGRIFAAYRSVIHAREAARDPELLGIAAGFVNDLTADVEAAGRQYRFRIPDELALAARFDDALVLIANEHYKKAIDLLRPLAAQLEDSSSIRNALARTSWIVARCNAAVEAIGASYANDFIPLVAAGARYNSILGNEDVAAVFVERLASLEPTHGLDLSQICSSFAYAGADRLLLELLERSPEIREHARPNDRDELVHFEAVARARLGDDERARELWRSLSDRDDLANKNLENLALPSDERRTPWYFGLFDVIPDEVQRLIADFRAGDADEADELREAILAEYPETELIAPFLAQHCDEAAGEFARWLAGDHASWYEPTGSIEVDGYTVTYDTVDAYPDDVTEIATRGHELLLDGKPEEAIVCFEEAIRVHDDNPSLLHNLASAHERSGRRDEALELMRTVHERFPDYFFARAGTAVLLTRDGRLEEARELAQPLLEKTEQHVTEFTVLCDLMCHITMEEQNSAELERWVARWEMVDEDDARLDNWRPLARLFSGMEHLTHSFGKLKRSRDPRGKSIRDQSDLFD